MASVANKLTKLQSKWKDAEPQKGGATEYPDGKYSAVIESGSIGLSKEKGNLQALVKWKILSPKKYKGKIKIDTKQLETEQGLPYFKGFAQTIGYEYPKNIKKLEETFVEFCEECDATFDLEFKTSGNFQNVYVRGSSEPDDDDEGEGDDDEGDEEDDDDDDEGEGDDEDDDAEDGEDDDDDDEEQEITKKKKSSKKKSSKELHKEKEKSKKKKTKKK